MCLMQEARKNTVPTLLVEISPYFCDPSMNGVISYNGVLKGWPGAEAMEGNKQILKRKWDLEGIYKDITRNRVCSREWTTKS